jgi:hypothetical protein
MNKMNINYVIYNVIVMVFCRPHVVPIIPLQFHRMSSNWLKYTSIRTVRADSSMRFYELSFYKYILIHDRIVCSSCLKKNQLIRVKLITTTALSLRDNQRVKIMVVFHFFLMFRIATQFLDRFHQSEDHLLRLGNALR